VTVNRTATVPKRVDVVGVPMDLGASRRGVDMGPYAVRYAQLHAKLERLGIESIVDHGNLAVPIRESAAFDDAKAKYLAVIDDVCERLAGVVEKAVREGGLPLVLGGDHSIAMGTLSGLGRARGGVPGLVWIDAHADINSPQSSACTACRSGLRCRKVTRWQIAPCRSGFATSIRARSACCASWASRPSR